MLLWPFNKYPGSDYETFNWDWVISQLRTIRESVKTAVESATSAESSKNSALQSEQTAVAAANSATSAADTLTEAVSTLSRIENRKFIFIGDSYAEGYNPDGNTTSWVTRTVQNLEKVGGTVSYTSSYYGGSGFVGTQPLHTWEIQLSEIANNTVDEDVTDIVLGGGWNDGIASASDFAAAVTSFVNRAKTYFPNAKIWLMMISSVDRLKYCTYNNLTLSNTDTAGRIKKALYYYMNIGNYGITYIDGLQYVCHGSKFLASDGLHPTQLGQDQLGAHIASALEGGSVGVYYDWEAVTNVTPATGVTPQGGAIYTSLENNTVKCMINLTQFEIASPYITDDGDGNTYFPLLSFSGGFCQGGYYNEMRSTIPVVIRDGTTYYTLQGHLRLNGRTLELALFNATGTGFGSHTINRILFDAANTMITANTIDV